MELNIEKKSIVAIIKFEVETKNDDEVINIFKENKEGIKDVKDEYSLYKEQNSNKYLFLFELENFESVDNIMTNYYFFEKVLSRLINSDYRWNIIGYVKSIKERESFIPTSQYMQLRHIEVPLNKIDSYLEWREKTRCKYIEENKEVKSFEVVPSSISGTPGVWFISEVGGDVNEYQEIIKQANDSHIKNNISTIIYNKIDLWDLRMTNKIDTKLIWLMSIACAFSVANLYYAQPILGLISEDLSITATASTIIVMLTQIGYAIGIILITPLADMVSKKKMILAVIPLCIFSLLLFAFSPNQNILLISALLIGLFGVTQQLVIPLTAELSTDDTRGYNIGRVMSGLLIGILLSRTFSGVIGELLGWQYVYILSAIFLIITECMLFLWIPHINMEPRTVSYFKVLKTIPSVFKRNSLLREASFNGLVMFASFNIVWTTLIFYLKDVYGYGSAVAGLLGIAGVAGALVAPRVGKKNDSMDSREIIRTGMIITLISFLLLVFLGEKMLILIISLILLDLGIQMCLVTNQSRIHSTTNVDRSRVNAIFVFFYFIGGSIGSFVGIFTYSNYGWTSTCITGILIIGSAYVVNTISKNYYKML